MREIKFRGIDIYTRKFVYGNLIDNGVENNPTFFILTQDKSTYDELDDVFRESIGQFTGLKDKNGKEIYEGDIVSLDKKEHYIIKFEHGCFVGNPVKSNSSLYSFTILNRNYLQYEVIGNIHQNPELLNK